MICMITKKCRIKKLQLYLFSTTKNIKINFRSRPRVKGFEGVFEAAACDVRVPIGGSNIFVAEHVLDEAEVGAVIEQVGRKRVA